MAATAKVVDWTNVKDGGKFQPRRVPEGDYRMKIVGVDDHLKDGQKVSEQWVFTLQIPGKRGTYPLYCNHVDAKQAWKIRNLCLAAGMQAPKKRVKLDPNKLVGKEIGAALEDDEYDGKIKSVIVATFPASELESDQPAGSGKVTDDDEEDDVDSSDDDEDLDDVDLEEV